MRVRVRPDIQALRAFAIASVVIFHLWPNIAPGGFVGVDIFFVISGFLITGALWREIESVGRIDLVNFWARRARRLLPASLLVICATALTAFFIYQPINFLSFSDEPLSATFYVENITLLIKQTDYLGSQGLVSPFQHFWSLSVEEQLYLAWPLLFSLVLLPAAKLGAARKRAVVFVLTVVVAASFAFNIMQTYQMAPVAYFSTYARAWEFGVGGLLAVLSTRSQAVEEQRKPLLFALGASAVFYSAFTFNAQTVFPGYAALLPVTGAVLLIFAGQSQHYLMPRTLVELKPWQFIGDLSYSIYLWHWPLIIFIPKLVPAAASEFGKVATLALAIVLSWITKSFVEDSLRHGSFARVRSMPQLGTALLAMLLTSSLVLFLGTSAQSKAAQSWGARHLNPSLLELHSDWPSIEKNENCVVSATSSDFRVCQQGDPNGTKTIALIGDSHARQIFDPLNSIAIRNHLKLFVMSKSHCQPMATRIFPRDYESPSCLTWNQKLERYLASTTRFDLIANMNASNYSYVSTDEPAAFGALVRSQLLRGSKWLVVRDNPMPKRNLAACLEAAGPRAATACSVSRTRGFMHADLLAEVVKKLPGVIYADFSDVFCTPRVCPPVIGLDIVYRDTHLTRTFSEKYMEPRLNALLSKELFE